MDLSHYGIPAATIIGIPLVWFLLVWCIDRVEGYKASVPTWPSTPIVIF